MKNQRNNRPAPTINAGSMADVAFLLLIFFLVVTTIDVDKGITVKLPPWCEENCSIDVLDDRVLSIKVNYKDELLVEGDEKQVSELRETAKLYIAEKGKETIISLQNDRSTSYDTYLSVYNELKAAFNEVWDEEALTVFGALYEDLNAASKKEIRTKYPLVISEAESSDIAISN